jgi:hypothetical protein
MLLAMKLGKFRLVKAPSTLNGLSIASQGTNQVGAVLML